MGVLLLFHAGNSWPQDRSTERGIVSGPVAVVNLSPIQLLFLQAIPERAETLPKNRGTFSVVTTMTNTLLSESSTDYRGVVDMEMIRSSMELRYGMAPGFEIGMSLPFAYSYPGFMDHAILDVEDFIGEPRMVRENQEPDTYEYFVKKGDKAFIAGKGKRTSGMGDTAFRLKATLLDQGERMPCLSARIGVKVPTGDTDRAMGSGELDFGFGLLLQKDIKPLSLYFNADVIFPGDAFEEEDVQLNEFYQMMLGAEYRVGSHTSLVAQYHYLTRPFNHTGLQMLDRRIYEFLLGVTYLTEGGVSIQGGVVEDYPRTEDAGADFTFFLNIGKGF